MTLWYSVRDLELARAFYVEVLGFEEVYRDEGGRWLTLARDGAELAIAEAEGGHGGEEEAVVAFDVEDVKAEADRLRSAGVRVGVVVEIPGLVRLLDVFDPDGNRLQLAQDL